MTFQDLVNSFLSLKMIKAPRKLCLLMNLMIKVFMVLAVTTYRLLIIEIFIARSLEP